MWSAAYDLSIDTARADALFASVLQISDQPSSMQVKQAIDAATNALGDLGCAALVAQEFGEHPDTAVTRMRWARAEVACAFASSSGVYQHPAGVRASRRRSPLSRSAAACA
jgi:hypothetical protein